MSPPRELIVYSVKTRRLLKRSKPADRGRSNSHGSVNPMVPCWGLPPPPRAQPEKSLPAAPEKVALGQVHRPDEAVLGAVAAADGEEARGLLRHLDVDHDLEIGRARCGRGLHLLEIPK